MALPRLFPPLLLLPALLTGCGLVCTDMGVISQLELHVEGTNGAPGLAGAVTLGDHTFLVDCDGDSDAGVTCEDDTTIFINLSSPDGTEAVTWSLSTANEDTASGGGAYVGSGTFTQDWVSTEHNGKGCGRTWSAEGTVELEGTP